MADKALVESAAPGINPPRQKRSEIAQRRILDALERLLKKRDYFDIAVSDIAREAKCAVGGVYNRFASKDHILLALAEKTLKEHINPRFERQENPHWQEGMSVQAFLEIYFTIVARPQVEFRHIFKPLAIVARFRKDEAFLKFLHERDKRTQAHLTRVLRPLAEGDNPVVDDLAIGLAVIWLRSLFREYVLFGDRIESLTGVADDRYFTELAHMIGRYLSSPEAGQSFQKGENKKGKSPTGANII